jgi:uncharacterized repeat protein (TIGR03803 family)
MKKILLSIIYFLVCILTVQAQILYSTTQGGGSGGAGTISKFIPATNTLSVIKSFISNDLTDGSSPEGTLMQANNGKLYGLTQFGGSNGLGVIFSLDPSSETYTKLKDFDGTNGGSPYGNSLIQASDGKLYGMTARGGSSGYGVIFSFDPSTNNYTKLIDFIGDNGAYPYGSLVQASDGKFYGMTASGGSGTVNSGYGTLFSYDPASSTLTQLGSPQNASGSLAQASDGKLYGLESGIDRILGGLFFSYDPSSSTFANLKTFNYDGTTGTYPDGAYPAAGVIQANDGKLYGMTSGGGSGFEGVIFSFDPSSSIYTKLKDFSTPDGADPLGNLMQATDGKLYGMTNFGGSSGLGIIFSFDPSTSTYTKLIDYNGTNGAHPFLNCGFIELKECITNTTYYRDADGDGFGDPNTTISVCATTPPAGYVNNNYDCNDHDTAKKTENEKVLMCDHGSPECIIVKQIQKKLDQGWTLGPCSSASSGSTIEYTQNVEIYSKKQIPQQYKLSNYPNPFVGRNTIKYELPFDSKVSITVYDLMGRRVATLVDENKKAGFYTIDFNAGHVSRGSLYYRIIAVSKDKQFKQTNKIIQLQ